MSEDPLARYVHDHLAGSVMGIDLLEGLRDDHPGEPLGNFAAKLLAETSEDRESLQQIADHLSSGYSQSKEAVAWVGAKLSRVKIGRSLVGDFGVFLALETLGLGIRGKLALWQTLAVVSHSDLRLRGIDFQRLAARAESQFAAVEERRLMLAQSVFQPVLEKS